MLIMPQSQTLPILPLVGRAEELAGLRDALDDLGRGEGGFWLVRGEGGAGKTRLGRELAEEAVRRGIAVAAGRGYPVEAGVPYALLADALQPVTRRLGDDAVIALTRGVAELAHIFPSLPSKASVPSTHGDVSDFRSRLHWHVTQFLKRLGEKQPFIMILEDLHWADASSLELLHFITRQLGDMPALIYCTYNTDYDKPPTLAALEQSLASGSVAVLRRLEPLSGDAVAELVQRVFDANPELTSDFVAHLYSWTRGNPFFLEETLKALVVDGSLRKEEDRWTGWETDRVRLPSTVRDAVLIRLGRLGDEARRAAELAAVLGARVQFELFAQLLGVSDADALRLVDELRRCRVLEEQADHGEIMLDFVHPLVREVLYKELGLLRSRLLHSTVATTLEELYGASALEHAGELAYHFTQAQTTDSRKAALYLRHAGEEALQKYANREAADYLTAALQRVAEFGDEDAQIDVLESLARARQRLGEYAEAVQLWERVQHLVLERRQVDRAAAIARRAGLACFWSGRHEEALASFDRGMAWAVECGDTALQVRLGIARASCLQNLGRLDDALDAASRALKSAGAAATDARTGLLGRAHRTLQQIYLWQGDAGAARMHGVRALALARESGDSIMEFMAHWAMCILESFGGNADRVEYHLSESSRIAGELQSPVLRVWMAELALEYATARGEWDAALSTGEEAIRMARALQQHALVPRLLVWTGLVHLARGDLERGESYVEEAWQLSGADNKGVGSRNVHAVLAAHIGRAGAQLARRDYEGAIRTGEEGLAIADRAGYAMWVVHRLLPIIAESHLWLRQLDGARRAGERLRQDSQRIGHRLGMAWACACDALVEWLGGNSVRGAVLLREAAELLEALPFMYDATRLRRQLAGRLADLGDREGALRELRLVHERLLRTGADAELQKARQQFRELGTRPPPLGGSRVVGMLTARELAVAQRVARRMSTKAVARDLSISVRTVDAHLANIYRKLCINSRAELTELNRLGELDRGTDTQRLPTVLRT
jgi:DNA-binding CsgD family transcriptional regulator